MSEQINRLAAGGRIDRTRPLDFSFNGRALQGYQGDTLASALLANDVHLVGRSFKYHRPRGIATAGPEEPSGLVQLGVGARTEPNIRATQVELHEGLSAASQNCWPSVDFDIGALNGLASPLLPSGFYYKTFMWPPAFWNRVYERVIRKAAGLGKAPIEPDPDRYEHRHAHCDVLVVGAGPAGLMAALAAGRSGARVILADQLPELGGCLLDEADEHPLAEWRSDALGELALADEVRLLPRTMAFAYYDHNYLALLERVTDHMSAGAPSHPRQRLWKVRAKQVVLATGAIERPLTFSGNDRPGVMLASAGRTYLNRFGVRPGRKVVLFTTNDSIYATALDLNAAGAEVVVVDARDGPGGALALRAATAGIRRIEGSAVVATKGNKRVRAVDVGRLSAAADRIDGATTSIDCDLVLMSGGWNPTIHLHSQSRGRPIYDPERAMFLPGAPAQNERSASACAGVLPLEDALRSGAEAGCGAAAAAGFEADMPDVPELDRDDEAPARVLWQVPSAKPDVESKRFVDFQNDVTAADIKLALREGYSSVEHVKRYTTTGMGTDQGKTSNVIALGIVSETTGQSIAELGVTTFRPPYTPVTFGALVGQNRGKLFDPVRKTPMHVWHEANGAVFEDVGQWKRPRFYPEPGEDMASAVDREVRATRTSIGMLDASTLGKIDLQGPDVAEFLNRIYTNAWSKLAIGRCRYGLMLGEDGMVFDDGVTARLGENHCLMSTTSGGAARVLAWLEEWLQTEWPDLKVFATSVTEQWATVSLSGPRTRGLVDELVEGVDLDPEAFPHMSVRDAQVGDVAARLFRISFTGEMGYEIQIPADYGLALWERCIELGERYDLTPFGTEAMHVLRAEKGYIITGQDTDGTATPADLGMDWIVSKKKGDFVGKRSLARADMQRDDRKQLVGLLSKDPEALLEEGAQIVADPNQTVPMTMIGHVTSSYRSPELGRTVALAMLKRGRELIGQTVYVPMIDRTLAVTVTETVFIDQEGARLHA
ncbi:MAG: sarcosine oxidase subunit alpha [Alphaproteobacteria bacterium]|nr:sarcosine oxidase subunit alpha [Alphaproteobacteria bacterium]